MIRGRVREFLREAENVRVWKKKIRVRVRVRVRVSGDQRRRRKRRSKDQKKTVCGFI